MLNKKVVKTLSTSPRCPALYTSLHRKHWERVKGIDFPHGPVAVMDSQGKAIVHRPHQRRELRQMARDAARREIVAMRRKPVRSTSI